MFDGTIRQQQAVCEFKILPTLCGMLDGLLHERDVFRMNTLENKLHVRCRGWLVLEDTKGFFRPDDLARGGSPPEASCMAESLGLRQIRFAVAQLLVESCEASSTLGDSLFEYL